MSAAPSEQRKRLLVLVAAIGLFIFSSVFMMEYLPDDTFISFRYAENLANGYGLTFNKLDRPVEGFSNLLWILVCALCHKLGLELPAVIPALGTAIGCLSVLLLWLLFCSRGLPPLQMLVPLFLLASCGPFIMYTISGMEMPLFALLLLVSIVWVDQIFLTGKLIFYLLLAITSVMVALCRPEGVATFPIILATMGWIKLSGKEDAADKTKWSHLIIASAVFLALMAMYHVWRINYFGELLPTPFLSKGGGGKSLFNGWKQNWRIYFIRQGAYYPPLGYYIVALVVTAIAGLKLSLSKWAHRKTETIAVVLVVVHLLIYFNFKDWMPGMRYHAPLVGLMLFTAVHVQTGFFRKKRESLYSFWMIGIALVVLNYSVLGQLRVLTKAVEKSNEKCLFALGKWLRDVMPAESTLGISDVGAIPYYSGFETIDIHPESLTDLWIAKNGFSRDYVFKRHPDIVIVPSRGIFSAKFYPEHYDMVNDKRFHDYRFIGVSRWDWDNDRCYWIYFPAGSPPLTDEQYENFPHGIGSVARKLR